MSAKKTFEANTFGASVFACGVFRGAGVAPPPEAYLERHGAWAPCAMQEGSAVVRPHEGWAPCALLEGSLPPDQPKEGWAP